MKDWYIDGIKSIYSLIIILFTMLTALIAFILLYPFIFSPIIQDILVYIMKKMDKIYNMF